MALDEPSAQLHLDIRDSIQTALKTCRPILHHLNADSSWFLQIPRPIPIGRVYYNILIDPWLSGGQSDLASWFSQQFHATESAVKNIAELEELARESEILADGLRLGYGRKTKSSIEDRELVSFIDAVAISHEFTDHCHRETNLEIHSDVPVFAIKEAADLIRSWKHFRTVVTVDLFGANGDTDWRSTSIPPLPDWIGISRLLQKEDVLNYHAALMITFNIKSKFTKSNGLVNKRKQQQPSSYMADQEDSAEAIVYTPHGMFSSDLHLITNASPPIRTLAFLHGMHNVRVGTASGRTALQSNLGAHNGLKAQRLLNAKYWISTHDEIKKGGGLVSWFLQRDEISLKDALDLERAERQTGEERILDNQTLDAFEGTNWYELANGESRILV